jgi:hypothetical protein
MIKLQYYTLTVIGIHATIPYNTAPLHAPAFLRLALHCQQPTIPLPARTATAATPIPSCVNLTTLWIPRGRGLSPFSAISVHAACSAPVGALLPIAPAPISRSLPVSDLCVLCVSVFSSLSLPFDFQLPALSRAEESTVNLLSPIPFRIRTYEKHTPNPFGIRSFKTKDLKLFRMCSYKKTGQGSLGYASG